MPDTRLPIARLYRPRKLTDLIGQEVLTQTLQGAFASGRTVQAYLLTGPRGTGKTSTARILTACFNCETGPTAEPCGTCDQCKAIAGEQHMDVMEIDGATYTKIEDVRELQSGLRYAPAQGRRKVVIVDEVHMLSRHAFNALLKTVEEPPRHLVFIFATTEPRKIPATILSRCQRFDLRPVPAPTLEAHYTWICEQEGVQADPAAIALIARAAAGSVRDGLSILGQAMANAEGRISQEAVADMLALGDAAAVAEAVASCLTDGPATGCAAIRNLLSAGSDPVQMLDDMLAATHASALAATTPEALEDSGFDARVVDAATRIAASLGARGAQQAWRAVAEGLEDARRLPDPARAVEMTLLRVASLGQEAQA